MTDTDNRKRTGRLAGLAYLGIIVFSIFGYTTVTRLFDGPPAEALARVVANHSLFVAAFIANLLGLAAWVAVGLLIHRLTAAVDRTAGVLLLLFVAGGVAMNTYAFLQLLPVVRSLVTDASAFGPIVEHYRRLLLLAQLFSGLWLFPFGWLIVRSRVAPWFLGVCLFVGGFGYLLLFTTAFVPGLDQALAYKIVSGALGVPAMVGEFGICLWLLINGAAPAPATSAGNAVV